MLLKVLRYKNERDIFVFPESDRLKIPRFKLFTNSNNEDILIKLLESKFLLCTNSLKIDFKKLSKPIRVLLNCNKEILNYSHLIYEINLNYDDYLKYNFKNLHRITLFDKYDDYFYVKQILIFNCHIVRILFKAEMKIKDVKKLYIRSCLDVIPKNLKYLSYIYDYIDDRILLCNLVNLKTNSYHSRTFHTDYDY